jgi:BASS family bile acid:Na+ symporter
VIGELFFVLLWATSFSLIVLFLAARMLAVGLAVTPDDLRAILRQRGLLARALLANVVAVPALAVLLVIALPMTPDARLAMLLLAAVPGGADVLAWRAPPAGGGRTQAGLVFVLSLVAIVVAPAMRLLMPQVGPPIALSYPRLIVVTVLGLLVPLLAGLAVRWAGPGIAAGLARIGAVLAVGLFVATLLAVVVIGGVQRRTLSTIDVIAMALFVLGAAALGWLLGGPTPATRRVLARATAMRNVGLALLLATVSIPHGGVGMAIVVFVVVLLALRALLARLDVVRRRRVSMDHVVPSA